MGTLYTRLSSITGEMSPESIEHHIARVMLEHIHQLNNISIGTMADLCSVSKSTISKFVKQLGLYLKMKRITKNLKQKHIVEGKEKFT